MVPLGITEETVEDREVGKGAGAESRRPMGVAVVGGMITSTFLTLVIIPVVYTIFSDVAVFFRRLFGISEKPAEPTIAQPEAALETSSR